MIVLILGLFLCFIDNSVVNWVLKLGLVEFRNCGIRVFFGVGVVCCFIFFNGWMVSFGGWVFVLMGWYRDVLCLLGLF